MKHFLTGCYLTGAVFTFGIVGAFTLLGGRSDQLWMPFAYAICWPVLLPLWLLGV